MKNAAKVQLNHITINFEYVCLLQKKNRNTCITYEQRMHFWDDSMGQMT